MNKRLDKTSLVMIIIFFVIIAAAVVGTVLVSGSMGGEAEKDNSVVDEAPDKKEYATVEEIVEEFKDICARGDVDALYDLYYDDYLTLMRENMQTPMDKESFDAYLKQEMQTVMGVDIYMYGDIEMPATQPPSTYASYIYAMVNNGAEMPVKPELVEDCANLVVYSNGTQSNHFVVKVDGSWYFVV